MDFLRFLAEYRIPALDLIFQTVTFLAQETFVVLIICWLYWCQNKKTAYTLGFTYFLSGLLVQGLKITFRIPRPWVIDPEFQPVPSAISGATGYSFPSGHTQSGTALFSTLGFAASGKFIRFLCFFLLAAVGFSRLYLGVHTPKDVLTAMLLTLLISFLVYFFLQPLLTHPAHTGKISLFLLLSCGFLMIYAGCLYYTGTADPEMAADALKAAGAGLGFAAGYFLERKYIDFSLPESRKEKALRFTAGLISVIIMMVFFELTIKKFLIGDIISYFLLILWIVAGYPALFKHYSEKRAA